ncbi:DUF2197 domain-containing protein [Syntrophomonas wolfei]|jgi:uncharacterized protein YlaI|uniref:DUF2197 domain-containing protein n=1 Tax=Syntrophomonas wolfei TaxID=863 RepID=A0A354Z0S1_9FIRM|nr:DUF2197 domain-containing protein [Syntrophomonas wolfei]HBK54561.1 DUF2197 domain-containing protein [Syntrophomonas wolfei]
MKQVAARCLLCGKTYDVEEDHKDFKKLSEQAKEVPSFICDFCSNRVRHESDEKRKEKKPI